MTTEEQTPHKFVLYCATDAGQEKNTYYPNPRQIKSIDDLAAATAKDNVFCLFDHHHRGNTDFLSSDCIGMDLDNGHTETEAYHKDLRHISKAFPDVEYYYIFSRNHMKEKHKKDGTPLPARFKVHLYFPLSRTYEKAEAGYRWMGKR